MIPSFSHGPVSLAGCLWGRWRQGELGPLPATLEAHVVLGSAHSSFLGVRETRGPALRSPRGTGGYQPSARDHNSARCAVYSTCFHPSLED